MKVRFSLATANGDLNPATSKAYARDKRIFFIPLAILVVTAPAADDAGNQRGRWQA